MPAHEKVSLQEIVNALLKWRGNVQAAAEDLGIRRNNLDERIAASGLDLGALRKGGTGITPFTRIVVAPPSPFSGNEGGSSGRVARSGRIVQRMSSASAVTKILKGTMPRIRPDHMDKLSDAKYDIQAILRRDVTETEILGEFIEDGLEKWLRAKLDELRKAEGLKK